jgi:hypothetical protein
MQTIHDCLQATLQNEYFKEKLTQFYKENKRLKEELEEVKLALKNEKKAQAMLEMRGTQTVAEAETNRLKGSTTCSVCIDRAGTANKALKSSSGTSMQEKRTEKTKTGRAEDFDNDVFNKQNKVNSKEVIHR